MIKKLLILALVMLCSVSLVFVGCAQQNNTPSDAASTAPSAAASPSTAASGKNVQGCVLRL